MLYLAVFVAGFVAGAVFLVGLSALVVSKRSEQEGAMPIEEARKGHVQDA